MLFLVTFQQKNGFHLHMFKIFNSEFLNNFKLKQENLMLAFNTFLLTPALKEESEGNPPQHQDNENKNKLRPGRLSSQYKKFSRPHTQQDLKQALTIYKNYFTIQ